MGNEKKPTSTELSSESSEAKSGEPSLRFDLGRSAELLVAAKLTELGFNVFFPFSDRSPVDLICCWGSHTNRVQVKARWQPRGKAGQDVTVSGVDRHNADTLVVHLHSTGSYYIIPTEEMSGEHTLIFFLSGRSGKPPRKYWDEWRDRWELLKTPTRT